ncbi:hypothetical protein FRC02_007584 [Tulasnella sp. 418]|nr:hypothetical protein FRC02_007584 [Tulasnella sp. 418]
MLKELILSDIHPLTAGSILASVKASPELVSIGSNSLPQDVAVDLLKLVGHAHDYPSISIAQTNPRELRVLQSSKSFNRFEVISEKDDGGRMTFSFFHQNYGTMFSSLGSFLDSSGRAKIQRLILNVPEYSNNGTYSCHHLLGDLNGLLDLHVENPGICSEILILLQLRCPNLRRLKICIAYDHVLSDLLEFVSIRYSDDASKPLLARLENIEIHRTSTGNIFRSLSRISKITGKGVVRCITEWRNGEYVTRGEERL